ncbi:MAG TPA: FIST N-terminal domain-containing protein [Mycobacteriales bacterium]|nr:FIST N-terminal domain-containing protein [Mycobacteriales bacterium]
MALFGDGLSADPDLITAAEQATRAALEPLGAQRPDLVCAFINASDPTAVEVAAARIVELSGAEHVIGCSVAGVIGAGLAIENGAAVSVWAAVMPDVGIRTFHLEVLRTDDSLAVVGMPERHDDDRVCLLLSDPFSFPADGFVERANRSMPGLPMAGGVAAGPRGAGSTRLLLDDRTVDRGAVGVMLSGPVHIGTIVSQGCRPIGPSMVVTAADGNAILGLAGAPALSKLEQIIAELPAEEQALASQGLHLGIVMNEYADDHQRGDFLIRGVLGGDRTRDAVLVGDVVEVGRMVRFQVRDADAASDELNALLEAAGAQADMKHVEGALLFSCTGRGAMLFPSAEHDVDTLRRHFAKVPVAGFFANGEIGPVGGQNHLHGYTASIVTFGPVVV